MNFIWYHKCSTCKNAKKFLDDNKIKYELREIKETPLSKEELKMWINKYDIDINKIFNTSGLVYRELNLKDKLSSLSMEEKINLLSDNPMLVKRPILLNDKDIVFGFKEEKFKKIINEREGE